MDEIDKLFVSLGLKSSLSGDVNAAVQDLNRLESEASKIVDQIAADFEKVGDSMKRMGKDLSFWVTTPLLAMGVLSTEAAGDAAETQSKFEEVFQGMSNSAEMWAESYGDAAGRATTDLQDMMATTMSIVKAMGMGYSEGTEFSEVITELAVDMASFNNSTDPEAFNALRAAITGEYESMKRYGVVLNEAKVEQELLTMGVKGGTKAATDAEKAQARLNIILRATADAQGDAERTADSFSNQVKALQADMKEMGETVGEDLLPIAKNGIDLVRQMIDGYERLDGSTRTVILVTAGFAAALGPSIWLAGSMVSSIGQLRLAIEAYKVSTFAATLATRGLSAALLTTPAGVVALAVAGLVSGLAILTWHLGRAEEKAFDLGDAMTYSSDQMREKAAELRAGGDGLLDWLVDHLDNYGRAYDHSYTEVQQTLDDAEAAQWEYAAIVRDAMDAAQAELQKADQSYSDHQRAVADLSREYDDLKASIDRALDFEEDLDDQARAIEHAQIAWERAKERRDNLGPDASKLDRDEANLAVRDAEDRLQDAEKRKKELEAEQKEFAGGRDLDDAISQAEDRLKEIEDKRADETAAMKETLKTRDELQNVYNTLAEQQAKDMGDGVKDRWASLKKYIEENPVAGKIGLDMNWFNAKLTEAGIPGIPAYASGGIVTKPTLALVGEAGPEAIIPLRGGGGDNTSIGGDTFNITINEAASPGATVEEIFRQIEEMTRARRVQRGVRG